MGQSVVSGVQLVASCVVGCFERSAGVYCTSCIPVFWGIFGRILFRGGEFVKVLEINTISDREGMLIPKILGA